MGAKQKIALLVLLIVAVWSWVLYRGAPAPARQVPPNYQAKSKSSAPAPIEVISEEEYTELASACMSGDSKACAHYGRVRQADGPKRTPLVDSVPAGGSPPPKPRVATPIDVVSLKIAYALANVEDLCRRGHKSACARLAAKDSDGLKFLQKTRTQMKDGCDDHLLASCNARALLEAKAGRWDDASSWLVNTTTLAGNIRSRCESGLETNVEICNAAMEVDRDHLMRAKEIQTQRLKRP